MSQSDADKTPHDARRVELLDEILRKVGGAMTFDPKTPPAARKVELMAAIRDAIDGGGSAAGVLGAGVTGITFCFRPRRESGDAESMSGYVVHGPHVNSFAQSSNFPQIGCYEIQLDRAYEPDEVAVFVWPGAFEDVALNVTTAENPTGAARGGMGGTYGGVVHAPQVWQTGPTGDKSVRLVFPVSLYLAEGGVVRWDYGNYFDPLNIMLVFFNRAAADYRNPAIPVLP